MLTMPEAQVLKRFRYDDFVIVDDDEAGGGVMGARKLELRFSDGKELEAKWKATDAALDGWNNSPRRELGAYAVQELFLDPPDHLVPPLAARCIRSTSTARSTTRRHRHARGCNASSACSPPG